ncbi:MAG: hypothetical protein JWM86_2742 [Thermoleophilia bacterium]|nr:hypothetical protein [Thermoleophilia bacterium]
MRMGGVSSDEWMVRVTHTRSTGATIGTIERHTALTGIDPMPGVHYMTTELGRLERVDPASPWRARRTSITARDGDEGALLAAAVYDAAHGFLALGIPPAAGPAPGVEPDRLLVEVGDDTWSFDVRSAPAAAWRILLAARGA